MIRVRLGLPMSLVLLAASPGAYADTFFTATLTGAQERPGPGLNTASGFATFVLNTAQTALTFSATVNGIDLTGTQSPSTADNLTNAHIHATSDPNFLNIAAPVVWGFIGAPLNDNNPNDVVVTPFASGLGGTVSGKWDTPEGNGTTLTAQLANILAGRSYINFHTTDFPAGAIRGQILATPEPSSMALLGIGVLGLLGYAARRRRSAG